MKNTTAPIPDLFSAEEAISLIQTAIKGTWKYLKYTAGVAHKAIKAIWYTQVSWEKRQYSDTMPQLSTRIRRHSNSWNTKFLTTATLTFSFSQHRRRLKQSFSSNWIWIISTSPLQALRWIVEKKRKRRNLARRVPLRNRYSVYQIRFGKLILKDRSPNL